MKKVEEVLKSIQDIGALEDIAQIRSALTDFSEEMKTEYEEFGKVAKERDGLITENKDLLKVNRSLFLKLGNGEIEPAKQKEATKPSEPRTYESLFNEDGGLK